MGKSPKSLNVKDTMDGFSCYIWTGVEGNRRDSRAGLGIGCGGASTVLFGYLTLLGMAVSLEPPPDMAIFLDGFSAPLIVLTLGLLLITLVSFGLTLDGIRRLVTGSWRTRLSVNASYLTIGEQKWALGDLDHIEVDEEELTLWDPDGQVVHRYAIKGMPKKERAWLEASLPPVFTQWASQSREVPEELRALTEGAERAQPPRPKKLQ